jgi:type 1 glutamine amidotransferase
MWTCPQGKSEVLGLTVGHDVNDWTKGPYQNLIIDGVNYLAEQKP